MKSARRFAAALAIVASMMPRTAIAGCHSYTVPIQDLGDFSQLNGISGSSPTDIWAVGDGARKSAPSDALIEHFDGVQWHLVPVQFYENSNVLNSVAAVSPTDAWAVGFSGPRRLMAKDLVLHWDGSAWSRFWDPTYNAGNYNSLSTVAVNPSNPNDVWALGLSYDSCPFCFFGHKILHWNGKHWTTYWYDNRFETIVGLSVSSTGQTWAVGGFQNNFIYPTPIVYHWDGSAWAKQSVPGYGILNAVSAHSDNDVWAVGSSGNSPGPLIEHYDGTKWAVVHGPEVGLSQALDAVSAIATNDVWASGGGYLPGYDRPSRHAFIEHWDGTSWSIVPSPNRYSYSSFLGIQALKGGALAVGYGFWPNNPPHVLSDDVSCAPIRGR